MVEMCSCVIFVINAFSFVCWCYGQIEKCFHLHHVGYVHVVFVKICW